MELYDIYTGDVHSLFAVEEIVKLWMGEYRETHPLLTKVAGDIEKRGLLLLAVLLHDIGKGSGKDHCDKGADMIPTIARRLGLNKEDSARLEFLVRNHLEMAHIAQRRDLQDDKLIVQFAQRMGIRITSYNVCYTKLLRKFLAAQLFLKTFDQRAGLFGGNMAGGKILHIEFAVIGQQGHQVQAKGVV